MEADVMSSVPPEPFIRIPPDPGGCSGTHGIGAFFQGLDINSGKNTQILHQVGMRVFPSSWEGEDLLVRQEANFNVGEMNSESFSYSSSESSETDDDTISIDGFLKHESKQDFAMIDSKMEQYRLSGNEGNEGNEFETASGAVCGTIASGGDSGVVPGTWGSGSDENEPDFTFENGPNDRRFAFEPNGMHSRNEQKHDPRSYRSDNYRADNYRVSGYRCKEEHKYKEVSEKCFTDRHSRSYRNIDTRSLINSRRILIEEVCGEESEGETQNIDTMFGESFSPQDVEVEIFENQIVVKTSRYRVFEIAGMADDIDSKYEGEFGRALFEVFFNGKKTYNELELYGNVSSFIVNTFIFLLRHAESSQFCPNNSNIFDFRLEKLKKNKKKQPGQRLTFPRCRCGRDRVLVGLPIFVLQVFGDAIVSRQGSIGADEKTQNRKLRGFLEMIAGKGPKSLTNILTCYSSFLEVYFLSKRHQQIQESTRLLVSSFIEKLVLVSSSLKTLRDGKKNLKSPKSVRNSFIRYLINRNKTWRRFSDVFEKYIISHLLNKKNYDSKKRYVNIDENEERLNQFLRSFSEFLVREDVMNRSNNNYNKSIVTELLNLNCTNLERLVEYYFPCSRSFVSGKGKKGGLFKEVLGRVC